MLLVGIMFLLSATARAQAGLVIETPTGLLGFLSNVGHVSIWISHGCLDPSGHVVYCEGSAGVVLTSTAYWPNPGAAAIPAELFFLGSQPSIAGRDAAAWDANLAGVYPSVEPAVGAKYLGRTWRRSLRVLKFETSPEEDKRVIAEVDVLLHEYRYSYSRRNCAYFAQSVLAMYFGRQFHASRALEFGIYTPRAVERALLRELATRLRSYETIHFKGNFVHAWRQPPRNICESAVLDPKYATPLLLYQPYVYVGFAACYVAIRVSTWSRTRRVHREPPVPAALFMAGSVDSRFKSFDRLTGVLATSLEVNYEQ